MKLKPGKREEDLIWDMANLCIDYGAAREEVGAKLIGGNGHKLLAPGSVVPSEPRLATMDSIPSPKRTPILKAKPTKKAAKRKSTHKARVPNPRPWVVVDGELALKHMEKLGYNHTTLAQVIRSSRASAFRWLSADYSENPCVKIAKQMCLALDMEEGKFILGYPTKKDAKSDSYRFHGGLVISH